MVNTQLNTANRQKRELHSHHTKMVDAVVVVEVTDKAVFCSVIQGIPVLKYHTESHKYVHLVYY